MSEIVTRLEVNCETGEAIEIPLTEAELAQREVDAQAAAEAQAVRDAEIAAKDGAKASAIAKLTALGLSDTEVSALIG
jgi:hypothetical protein